MPKDIKTFHCAICNIFMPYVKRFANLFPVGQDFDDSDLDRLHRSSCFCLTVNRWEWYGSKELKLKHAASAERCSVHREPVTQHCSADWRVAPGNCLCWKLGLRNKLTLTCQSFHWTRTSNSADQPVCFHTNYKYFKNSITLQALNYKLTSRVTSSVSKPYLQCKSIAGGFIENVSLLLFKNSFSDNKYKLQLKGLE